MQTTFWTLVGAVVLGSLLGKVASLTIDILLWIRSWCVAVMREASKHVK